MWCLREKNMWSHAATTRLLKSEVFQMQNSFLSPSKVVIKHVPKQEKPGFYLLGGKNQ